MANVVGIMFVLRKFYRCTNSRKKIGVSIPTCVLLTDIHEY